MIQRIDANTEDVVDNVQGAQRELMRYWSRVSGNRWLVAKMFGVLMVRLPSCPLDSADRIRYSSCSGYSLLDELCEERVHNRTTLCRIRSKAEPSKILF